MRSEISPGLDAQRLPGKRRLENPLSQIAREKEAVRPLAAQRGEKTQLSDTDVLGLVHDGEVERRIPAILELPGEQAEHAGPSHQTPVPKFGLDLLNDGPERRTLLHGQARLASKPSDIAIGVPAIQLPCVNDVLPLAQQESEAEPARLPLAGGFRQKLLNHLPSRDLWGAEPRLIKPLADRIHGVDLHAFRKPGLVVDQPPELRP